MRIERYEVRELDVPIAHPYSIASGAAAGDGVTACGAAGVSGSGAAGVSDASAPPRGRLQTSSVRMLLVRLVAEGGAQGLGTATPEVAITGESFESCRAALESARWLEGEDGLDVHLLGKRIEETLPATPGARAALDMALHDLWARLMEAPLADLLGRAHRALETSVTIGILPAEETLARGREHVARGFRALKVKVGTALDEDVRRLELLRSELGPSVALRADANAGYRLHEVEEFFDRTGPLGLECLEQPVAREHVDGLRRLPVDVRTRLAADESLHGEADAHALLVDPRPFGIWVVKLMKCGGIAPALRLSALARREGVGLMWSCMDESVVGIAAALHAAYASSATRWLDLDGSFDLTRDFARGGFVLEHGKLRTLAEPGLGVRLA